MIKKEKGVTLVLLIVTVMILMVIAGVIINSGVNSAKTAERESLKTNMLLIQAKGKEYVENANFKLGTTEKTEEEKNQIKSETLKGKHITEGLPEEIEEGKEAYELSPNDMKDLGLNELEQTANDYIIIYDIDDETVDVMYKPGIVENNKQYYTLTEMEELGI